MRSKFAATVLFEGLCFLLLCGEAISVNKRCHSDAGLTPLKCSAKDFRLYNKDATGARNVRRRDQFQERVPVEVTDDQGKIQANLMRSRMPRRTKADVDYKNSTLSYHVGSDEEEKSGLSGSSFKKKGGLKTLVDTKNYIMTNSSSLQISNRSETRSLKKRGVSIRSKREKNVGKGDAKIHQYHEFQDDDDEDDEREGEDEDEREEDDGEDDDEEQEEEKRGKKGKGNEERKATTTVMTRKPQKIPQIPESNKGKLQTQKIKSEIEQDFEMWPSLKHSTQATPAGDEIALRVHEAVARPSPSVSKHLPENEPGFPHGVGPNKQKPNKKIPIIDPFEEGLFILQEEPTSKHPIIQRINKRPAEIEDLTDEMEEPPPDDISDYTDEETTTLTTKPTITEPTTETSTEPTTEPFIEITTKTTRKTTTEPTTTEPTTDEGWQRLPESVTVVEVLPEEVTNPEEETTSEEEITRVEENIREKEKSREEKTNSDDTAMKKATLAEEETTTETTTEGSADSTTEPWTELTESTSEGETTTKEGSTESTTEAWTELTESTSEEETTTTAATTETTKRTTTRKPKKKTETSVLTDHDAVDVTKSDDGQSESLMDLYSELPKIEAERRQQDSESNWPSISSALVNPSNRELWDRLIKAQNATDRALGKLERKFQSTKLGFKGFTAEESLGGKVTIFDEDDVHGYLRNRIDGGRHKHREESALRMAASVKDEDRIERTDDMEGEDEPEKEGIPSASSQPRPADEPHESKEGTFEEGKAAEDLTSSTSNIVSLVLSSSETEAPPTTEPDNEPDEGDTLHLPPAPPPVIPVETPAEEPALTNPSPPPPPPPPPEPKVEKVAPPPPPPPPVPPPREVVILDENVTFSRPKSIMVTPSNPSDGPEGWELSMQEGIELGSTGSTGRRKGPSRSSKQRQPLSDNPERTNLILPKETEQEQTSTSVGPKENQMTEPPPELPKSRLPSFRVTARKPNVQREPKILGASFLDLTQHPYVAVLAGKLDTRLVFLCTTTILSETWALSCAHCFFVDGEELVINRLVVVTGQTSSDLTNLNPNAAIFVAKEIHIHPMYTEKSFESITHDLGLVRVRRPFKFNEYTQMISIRALPLPYLTDPDTDTLIPLLTQSFDWDPQTQQLQAINVTLRRGDVDPCPCINWQLSKGLFCTFRKPSETICHGDFGGPLVYRRQLIGIAQGIRSARCDRAYILEDEDCDDTTKYAMYINTCIFLDWLNRHVPGVPHQPEECHRLLNGAPSLSIHPAVLVLLSFTLFFFMPGL